MVVASHTCLQLNAMLNKHGLSSACTVEMQHWRAITAYLIEMCHMYCTVRVVHTANGLCYIPTTSTGLHVIYSVYIYAQKQYSV